MAAHTALRGIARPSTLSVAPSIPRLVSAASISSSTARCHDPRGPLGLYVLLRNGPEYKPSHLLVRAASGVVLGMSETALGPRGRKPLGSSGPEAARPLNYS
jgi:hypothetical protein